MLITLLVILRQKLTRHFITDTFLVLSWTTFCPQNCINSLWHRFKKLLETYLRDVGPYLLDIITQVLQMFWLHIQFHLLFHQSKGALLDLDFVTVEGI